MLGLGFGFVEVGTITPQPQPGNPKPRLFRLAEDEGVINRLGFNNAGQAAAIERLALRDRSRGVVGINIGANKDSADRIADYAAGVRAMAPLADYLTVNISSPNTPGLRDLQAGGELVELLAAVSEARVAGVPIFLKVAPDLDEAEPEPEHGRRNFAILVEPRRQPDRRGEAESGDAGGQGTVELGRAALGHQFQRADCRAMRALGVEAENQRAEEGIKCHHQCP